MRFLANPTLVSAYLLWLVIILVAGTIMQKYAGLYTAQQRYFASFFFFLWGIVPLPAVKSVLLLLAISLTAKLAQAHIWTRKKLGSNIVHAGVLVLLLGPFVTGYDKIEGAIYLEQGQSKAYVEDYYKVELLLRPTYASGAEYVVGSAELSQSAARSTPISRPNLPFALQLTAFYDNIDLQRLQPSETVVNGEQLRGFAKIFRLIEKKSELKSEENLSGMNFVLLGTDSEELGHYAIFENMPIIQTLADFGYQAILRAERYELPFAIQLRDFEATNHPASQIPSNFESIVNVAADGLNEPSVISMNRPLRYKDWTIYQSAFVAAGAPVEVEQASEGEAASGPGERPEDQQKAAARTRGEISILAAVRNSGRLLPYISGLIISVGLLLHLFMRLPGLTGMSNAARRRRTATP